MASDNCSSSAFAVVPRNRIGLGGRMITDMITITRAEYDRLYGAECQYAARYEAAAAEMRRIQNQAHQQLAVATTDLEKLRLRIKELEGQNG